MTSDPKPQLDLSSIPANPLDIPEKAEIPDPDETVPDTLPTTAQEAAEPSGKNTLVQEHHTGRAHAEPTNVTDASNDNAIDSEYIDVGGGD